MSKTTVGRDTTQSIRALVAGGDDEFDADATKAFGAEHGIQVSYEPSPEKALETVADGDIDCLVYADASSSDTREFLGAVQDRDRDLPIVVLTGGNEAVASEAVESSGTTNLLTLDIDHDSTGHARLANHVRTLVDRHRIGEDYEGLLEHAPGAIAAVAADGTILAANHTLADRVGRERDSLVGATITAVLPDGVGDRRLDVGRRVIDTGEPERTEDSYDGQSFENVFVPAGSGGRDSFQVLSRDVTARKERERAFERYGERLERVATAVSHELRNPLNVAQSFTDLLGDQYDDSQIDRVERALSDINDIIDDVVALARKTDRVSDPSPVDFERMVKKAWSRVDTDEVTLDVDADLRIDAADDRLEELLCNLFENAVEHADSVETVTVGTTDDGFYVADDGDGIPDEYGDEVFDTGFSTGRGGTGLGLTLVREIAAAHGWTAELAESDAGGARFDVRGVERAYTGRRNC